jgi:hypothetical protein
MSSIYISIPFPVTINLSPLLGAAFLFWGSPRIKKRQDRGGATATGWVLSPSTSLYGIIEGTPDQVTLR